MYCVWQVVKTPTILFNNPVFVIPPASSLDLITTCFSFLDKICHTKSHCVLLSGDLDDPNFEGKSGLVLKMLFYKQIKMPFLQRRVSWGSHSPLHLSILFSLFVTDSKNLRIGFYDAGVSKLDACHPSVVTEIPVAFHNSSPTTLTSSVTVSMIRGTAVFVFMFSFKLQLATCVK